MAPRILILSASVGVGHVRAAQAIELALREVLPDAAVENRDVLSLTNAAFRRVYGKAYLDLVNKAPHFLGYFYDMLDRPSRSGTNRGDRLRLLVEKFNLKAFMRLLRAGPWDLIINTHFLPAEIIAALRREGKLDVKQVTVTTDFETHRLWVNQPCELYCTATEEGALYLQYWGVPAGATRVTGIPIHPVFAQSRDRQACLERHQLPGDRPIILQMTGGFAVGPVEKIFKAILQVQRPLDVVAVAGRNEKARTQLESVAVPPRHRVRILGFTDQVDELMTVADLVVSKPGGLTTSETLARGAAMVIVNPTPGQENRNNDYLLENGAAIKVNNLATLAFKVDRLLADPQRLMAVKENARRQGKPRAAYEVVERSLDLIRKPC